MAKGHPRPPPCETQTGWDYRSRKIQIPVLNKSTPGETHELRHSTGQMLAPRCHRCPRELLATEPSRAAETRVEVRGRVGFVSDIGSVQWLYHVGVQRRNGASAPPSEEQELGCSFPCVGTVSLMVISLRKGESPCPLPPVTTLLARVRAMQSSILSRHLTSEMSYCERDRPTDDQSRHPLTTG